MEEFIGTIKMFVGNYAPEKWALCDGQLLQIKDNIELFSILGNRHGGDGIDTFALPDLRGRTPIGFGQVKGLPNYKIGQTGGHEPVAIPVEYIRVGKPSQTDSGHSGFNVRVVKEAPTESTAPPYIAINFIISINGPFYERPKQ